MSACEQCGREVYERRNGERLCDGGCVQLAESGTHRFRRGDYRPIAILEAASVKAAIAGMGTGAMPGGHTRGAERAGRSFPPGARERSPAPGVRVALAVDAGEPAVVDVALLRRALRELARRSPIVVLAETSTGRTVGFEWGGDGRRGAYYLPACADKEAPRKTVTAAPAR